MSHQDLEQGNDNAIVRNQEVYAVVPQDVIDRMGNTATQLLTEADTCLEAINELKSNLTYNVLSGSSAFTATSGTTVSKAELHKFGKVVTLYLQGSRSSYTANAYTKIGEIPSDYAPSSQAILMSIRPDMNQAVGYISISSTGEITMYRTATTGTNLYITLTWVI